MATKKVLNSLLPILHFIVDSSLREFYVPPSLKQSTRSVQKVSDFFLSRQQIMSESLVQRVVAHTYIHA